MAPAGTHAVTVAALRSSLLGVRLSVLGTRGKNPDGRYEALGEPQDWEVVGLTRKSVVLAPVTFNGEAMRDKRASFKLPDGVREHSSGLVSVIHPEQTKKLIELMTAVAS